MTDKCDYESCSKDINQAILCEECQNTRYCSTKCLDKAQEAHKKSCESIKIINQIGKKYGMKFKYHIDDIYLTDIFNLIKILNKKKGPNFIIINKDTNEKEIDTLFTSNFTKFKMNAHIQSLFSERDKITQETILGLIVTSFSLAEHCFIFFTENDNSEFTISPLKLIKR